MSAETRTTSSTGGQKGVKLERFDLIPVGPLTALATHFGRGARKYDDNQWRKGYEWSKSYAAKQRHDNLFWAGFDYDVCENDPEGCSFVDQHGEPFEQFESEHGHGCYNHTTSHHLDASNWHGFVLREFTVTHPEHDDRFKPPASAEEPEPEVKANSWATRMVREYDESWLAGALRPTDIWTIVDEPKFGVFHRNEPCDLVPIVEARFVVSTEGEVADRRPERTFFEVLEDAEIVWRDPVARTGAAYGPALERVNEIIQALELGVIPRRFIAGMNPSADDEEPEVVGDHEFEPGTVFLVNLVDQALNRRAD